MVQRDSSKFYAQIWAHKDMYKTRKIFKEENACYLRMI